MRCPSALRYTLVDISLTTGAGELTKKCVNKAVTWRGKCTGKCTGTTVQTAELEWQTLLPMRARIKLSQGAQIHTAAHEQPQPAPHCRRPPPMSRP